jgi:small-conductance mechanosensitive channel/CRP-like cAMP-binding protein
MLEIPRSPGDLVTSETVGVAIAVALIALLRVILPAGSRRLARAPTAFLAVHLLARVVAIVLDRGSIGHRGAALAATVLLFASVGRSAVLIALDGVAARRLSQPLPRIFRDIIQGVVYMVLLLVALRTADVDPGSILTTSALLTAAIALSLQETLGNLVAGLAIQMQHPFDVDDWIQFDSDLKHIGKVLEINWRATKVLTLDDVEVIIPNATLAKAPITNFTKPHTYSRRSIYFQVHGDVAPHLVRAAVLDALPGARGVLETPQPSVVVSNFVDGNLEYWVRFYTDQFHLRDGVDSAARERIWYALSRAGIAGGLPNRNVMIQEVSSESRARDDAMQLLRREEALSSVDFMRVLTEGQRRTLAGGSRIHLYGVGEPIVKQGDNSAEMFIVQSGQVAVQSEGNGSGPIEVARLGPGEFFGEMALMTGEVRTATVRADMPSTLIGVDQSALKTLLESSPELAAIISRVITERQAAHDSLRVPAHTRDAIVEERSSQLLGRIRKFFAL